MMPPKFVCIFVLVAVCNLNFSSAGGDHHHIRHRIHVPTKVKTIYHTKIIKVPEHHHYIHEKEKPKLVKIPEHHHYFHEKEKEKLVDISHLHQLKDDGLSLDGGTSGGGHDFDFGAEHSHNIYKKHAPPHAQPLKKTKKRPQKRY